MDVAGPPLLEFGWHRRTAGESKTQQKSAADTQRRGAGWGTHRAVVGVCGSAGTANEDRDMANAWVGRADRHGHSNTGLAFPGPGGPLMHEKRPRAQGRRLVGIATGIRRGKFPTCLHAADISRDDAHHPRINRRRLKRQAPTAGPGSAGPAVKSGRPPFAQNAPQ